MQAQKHLLFRCDLLLWFQIQFNIFRFLSIIWVSLMGLSFANLWQICGKSRWLSQIRRIKCANVLQVEWRDLKQLFARWNFPADFVLLLFFVSFACKLLYIFVIYLYFECFSCFAKILPKIRRFLAITNFCEGLGKRKCLLMNFR